MLSTINSSNIGSQWRGGRTGSSPTAEDDIHGLLCIRTIRIVQMAENSLANKVAGIAYQLARRPPSASSAIFCHNEELRKIKESLAEPGNLAQTLKMCAAGSHRTCTLMPYSSFNQQEELRLQQGCNQWPPQPPTQSKFPFVLLLVLQEMLWTGWCGAALHQWPVSYTVTPMTKVRAPHRQPHSDRCKNRQSTGDFAKDWEGMWVITVAGKRFVQESAQVDDGFMVKTKWATIYPNKVRSLMAGCALSELFSIFLTLSVAHAKAEASVLV